MLCFICCFIHSDGELETLNLLDNLQFKLFCEQLEFLGSRQSQRGNGDKLDTLSLLTQLDNQKRKLGDKRVSVCSECLNLIAKAISIKMKGDEVEKRVRKLQVELLKELKELDGIMTDYNESMRRVGETVEDSNGLCLEHFMDKNCGESETRLKQDANLFRKRVLEVSKDVETYHKFLQSRVNVKRQPSNSKKQLQSTKPSIFETPFKTSNSALITPSHRVSRSSSGRDLPASTKIAEGVALKTETDIRDSSPMNDEHLINDDDDFMPEDGFHDTDTDSSSGSNYSDAARPVRSCRKRKRTSSHPVVPTIAKKQRTPVPKPSSSKSKDQKVNFTGMGPFKISVIKRALLRAKKRPQELSSATLEQAPDKQFPITYLIEEDKLMQCDIEIRILEEERNLQCSLCDFTPAVVNPDCTLSVRGGLSERNISRHILSKHKDLFQCPYPDCDKRFQGGFWYREHLKIHTDQVRVCDICGKPMIDKGLMARHKWSHMSEEEKQLALQNGMQDPRLKNKDFRERSKNLRFQCSQCGKEFRTSNDLKNHEMRHEDSSRRKDRVVCPKCGKSMYRMGYENYHKLFSCPGRDDKEKDNVRKIKCIHCDKEFNTMLMLKMHMKRSHDIVAALERPFKCNICGKGYKTNICLWTHKKTHNQSRDWICAKCGKDFNSRKNWKRHEEKCKWSGVVNNVKYQGVPS